MKEKIIPVVAIIALILSVWSLVVSLTPPSFPIPSPTQVAQKFGAIGGQLLEQYLPYVQYNGGLKTQLSFQLGSTTPKEITNIAGGTCNLTTGAGNNTPSSAGDVNDVMNASSTKMHFCAATGARVGDQIWVTLPSSLISASSSALAGPGLNGSIIIAGATATTSDIIGVALTNFTGVATGSYAQATTGVQYLIFR